MAELSDKEQREMNGMDTTLYGMLAEAGGAERCGEIVAKMVRIYGQEAVDRHKEYCIARGEKRRATQGS